MLTRPSPLTAPRKYVLSQRSRIQGVTEAIQLCPQYSIQGKSRRNKPTSKQTSTNTKVPSLWTQVRLPGTGVSSMDVGGVTGCMRPFPGVGGQPQQRQLLPNRLELLRG